MIRSHGRNSLMLNFVYNLKYLVEVLTIFEKLEDLYHTKKLL